MKKYIWHTWLGMPKKNLAWHQSDVADEYAELEEARGFVDRWSEKSDVVYTVTRGRWSGHKLDYPIGKRDVLLGMIYMYPKYTMRFLFFKRAAKKTDSSISLRQVRNPKKIHKLHHIAEKHGLNPQKFEEVCTKQYKYWRFILPR